MSRQVNQALGVIVFLSVAAFAGLLVYKDFQHTEQTKKDAIQSKLLFALDSKLDVTNEKDRNKLIEEVSEVVLHNGTQPKGQQTFSIQRDDHKHWVVQAPIKTPADENEIKYVLRDVMQAKAYQVALEWKENEKKPEAKLKEFGLTDAQHQVSFTFRKLKYSLWLGQKHQFSGKYYALLPDHRKVVLVDTSVQTGTNKKLFDLRRKEVFTQQTQDIQTLAITRPSDQLVFEKRKEALFAPIVKSQKHDHAHDHGHDHGHDHSPKKVETNETRWYMNLPTRSWASTNDVNSLISALKYLRASKFVSEDAKKNAAQFGLDKPRIMVEVVLANKKRLSLNIGTVQEKGTTKVYAASPQGGPVAEVGDYILRDLEKKAFEYRDRQILRFKSEHVFSVRYGAGDKLYSVVRQEGIKRTWSIFSPSPERADVNKMDQFLRNLDGLKVSRFVKENANEADLKTYGLFAPARTYQLFGQTTKQQVGSLFVGNKTAEGYYVTNHTRKPIALVSAKDLEKLPTEPWQVIKDGKPPKKAPTSQPATPRKASTLTPTRTAPIHRHDHHNHNHDHKHHHAAPSVTSKPAAPTSQPGVR